MIRPGALHSSRRVLAHALTAAALALAASACGSGGGPSVVNDGGPDGGPDAGPDAGSAPFATHSSSLALSADGKTLYAANADLDSVSKIDTQAQSLTQETLPAPAHPAPDADAGTYLTAVGPRSLALSPDGSKLYVSGQRSGMLYEVAASTGTVTRSVAVGAEPLGVLVALDGSSIYVACTADAAVVKVDAASFTVSASAAVSAKPWALSWSSSTATPGIRLYTTHLLGPGITAIDPSTMIASAVSTIPDMAPRGDKRLAHGQVRGIYDLLPRPGTSELWSAHLLLGTDTPQPDLDFESTAFAAFSVLDASGTFSQTLSINASDVPGVNGSINDVVSGPHALAFTSDGDYALSVDSNSADLLAIDARSRHESTLLRPLPGKMPEGVVISPDGTLAYIDERNTNDIAIVKLDRSTGALVLSLIGSPIQRSAADPMPAQLRLGQHLFFSADSSEYPITRDHWVACSSCHLEGRSDAVTWKFSQGPRDTPSNAGGTSSTGFLFRTADRNKVQDYWHTIDVEQGGNFNPDTDPQQAALLDALAAYVNLAIPLPVPPKTDPTLVAQGKVIFNSPAVGCASCHSGPSFTDSGAGNPTLDLTGVAGPVLLHDVGTCVTTGYPDMAHLDVLGDARAACMFDTPSLNGIADSAPYLHDGSAATLMDVLELTRGKMGDISSLSASDEQALVEYLRSL